MKNVQPYYQALKKIKLLLHRTISNTHSRQVTAKTLDVPFRINGEFFFKNASVLNNIFENFTWSVMVKSHNHQFPPSRWFGDNNPKSQS